MEVAILKGGSSFVITVEIDQIYAPNIHLCEKFGSVLAPSYTYGERASIEHRVYQYLGEYEYSISAFTLDFPAQTFV